VDQMRQVAADLGTLVARDVDLCMREVEAARHRLRVTEAKAQQAWADVELAKAELLNANELLASARTRFGVAWPAVRQGLAPSASPAESEAAP
jgi:hypothetical protein